jgi:uncharacterized membrane protein
MSEKPAFLYVASYDDVGEAELDFDAAGALYSAGLIGTYDAALITKRDGKVHVHKTEKPTRHGAWTGVGVGAVVGLLFPPSIVGAAAVGGVAGGVVGHLRKGISRGDLKDLGQALQEGEAAVVVIGEAKIDKQLEEALAHADRRTEKQIDADAKDVEAAIEQAAKGD